MQSHGKSPRARILSGRTRRQRGNGRHRKSTGSGNIPYPFRFAAGALPACPRSSCRPNLTVKRVAPERCHGGGRYTDGGGRESPRIFCGGQRPLLHLLANREGLNSLSFLQMPDPNLERCNYVCFLWSGFRWCRCWGRGSSRPWRLSLRPLLRQLTITGGEATTRRTYFVVLLKSSYCS